MFVPVGEVSEETKEKLREFIRRRDERLAKMVEDYHTGKLIIPEHGRVSS